MINQKQIIGYTLPVDEFRIEFLSELFLNPCISVKSVVERAVSLRN